MKVVSDNEYYLKMNSQMHSEARGILRSQWEDYYQPVFLLGMAIID